MAWWVIALAVWIVASFAAAGVVVLLARRGRVRAADAATAEQKGAADVAPAEEAPILQACSRERSTLPVA